MISDIPVVMSSVTRYCSAYNEKVKNKLKIFFESVVRKGKSSIFALAKQRERGAGKEGALLKRKFFERMIQAKSER